MYKLQLKDVVKHDAYNSVRMEVTGIMIERTGIYYRCEWWAHFGTLNTAVFPEENLKKVVDK